MEWRESIAGTPRASFSGETYWAKPLPGFGDPAAQLLIVGLAPAAHGGNRTGRMFTGDRSGDFLYAALHRFGFASQPTSTGLADGLSLHNAYITAAVRCAPPDNKPTPAERNCCSPFLLREIALLAHVRVVLTLGAFALEALERAVTSSAPTPPKRTKFAHGLEIEGFPLGEKAVTVVCSYHPSQRNVFTGLLTATMFDDVLARVGQRLSAQGFDRPAGAAGAS